VQHFGALVAGAPTQNHARVLATRANLGVYTGTGFRVAMGACDADDWPALLDAWIDTVVREYLSSYPLHDAIFHDPAVCHRCVMGEEPIVQALAALIEGGRQKGVWDAEDVLATAVCMFHGLHGMLDEAIAMGADTAQVAPRLSRLFANMLRPH
jgi:hypothetical protein